MAADQREEAEQIRIGGLGERERGEKSGQMRFPNLLRSCGGAGDGKFAGRLKIREIRPRRKPRGLKGGGIRA